MNVYINENSLCNEEVSLLVKKKMDPTFWQIETWQRMLVTWNIELSTHSRKYNSLNDEICEDGKYNSQEIMTLTKETKSALDDVEHFIFNLATAEKVSILQKMLTICSDL